MQPSDPLDNSIRVHGRVFGPSFVVASPDTRKKILDKQNDVLPSPEFGSKRNAHTGELLIKQDFTHKAILTRTPSSLLNQQITN